MSCEGEPGDLQISDDVGPVGKLIRKRNPAGVSNPLVNRTKDDAQSALSRNKVASGVGFCCRTIEHG